MDCLTVVAQGVPEPQGSTRGFYARRLGRVVITSDNDALKPWRAIVTHSARVAALHAHWSLLHGPVALDVEFVMPRPKAHRRDTLHAVRPDLDKLLRAVCDALTGIAWVDDSQVAVVSMRKRYVTVGERSGVLIEVRDGNVVGDRIQGVVGELRP